MATIIEHNAMWTLTDGAAEEMVKNNLLVRCDEDHKVKCEEDGSDNVYRDVLPEDLPIYHIHRQAPEWFGFTTIPSAIIDAEKKVEV